MQPRSLAHHSARRVGILAAAALLAFAVGCEPSDGDSDTDVAADTAMDADMPDTGCTTVELTDDDVDGGATLSGDTCYEVNENIIVSDGTLQIEAGARIAFATDVGMRLSGSSAIVANGTADDPVVFTSQSASPAAGDWKGLWLSGSPDLESRLDNTIVEYGGSSDWSSNALTSGCIYDNEEASPLVIASSTIQNCANHGIRIAHQGGSAGIEITGTTFRGSPAAVSGYPGLIDSLAADNLIEDDGTIIEVGEPGQGDLEVSATMHDFGVPYVFPRASLDVLGVELTIEAGAELHFAAETGLTVRGEGSLIQALGTSESPVLMRGIEDGYATWRGMWLTDTLDADNRLEHTIIRGGGDSLWTSNTRTAGAIFIDGGAALTITDSELRDSAIAGIAIEEASVDLTITGSVVSGNESVAQINTYSAGGFAADNDLTGNTLDAIVLYDGIDRDMTWAGFEGVEWHLTERHVVNSATLTIEPGARIVGVAPEGNSGIQVNDTASLNAVGTADAPIVMTAGTQTPGGWLGLYFNGALASTIDHLVVEYGGEAWSTGPGATNNIWFRGQAQVTIGNVTVQDSAGWGTVWQLTEEGFAGPCDNLVAMNNAEGPSENITDDNVCVAPAP